jgi:hypothetical protein
MSNELLDMGVLIEKQVPDSREGRHQGLFNHHIQ